MSVSQNSKILASDCVSTATASTLVLRDSNGDFASRYVSLKQVKILDADGTEIGSMISTTKGTTSAEGWNTLTLGNSKTSTTASNASGKIVIYNKQGNSTTITGEYTTLLNVTSRSYIKSNQAIASCVGFSVMDSDSTEIGGFYSNTKGTTSVEGISDLLIGNAKASNVANNASGRIRIYNATGDQFWIYTRTFTVSSVSGSTTTGAKFLYFGGSSDGSNIRTYINNELHTNILSITRPNTSNYSERYVYGSIDTPTLGTASVEGWCTLTLGNSKTSTTAHNASGKIVLYTNTGSSVSIRGQYIGSTSWICTDNYIHSKYGMYIMDPDDVNIGRFTYNTKGTTSAEGSCSIYIGNDKATGTANNSSGELRIFGASGNYFRLSCGSSGAQFRDGFVSFANASFSGGGYTDAAVQIREYNYVSKDGTYGLNAGPNGWGSAPRLAFHWAGLTAATVGLATNGYLYEAPGTGTTYYQISLVGASSRAIKNYIKPLPDMGEQIDRLNPVSFIYKNRASEGIHYGLIHEDTVGIIPDVCKFDQYTDGGRYINYEDLVPVLIKEVQSLRKRVKQLENNSSPQIEDEL